MKYEVEVTKFSECFGTIEVEAMSAEEAELKVSEPEFWDDEEPDWDNCDDEYTIGMITAIPMLPKADEIAELEARLAALKEDKPLFVCPNDPAFLDPE